MTNIICIANQKGGVGKTTTSVNLSSALASLKKRTLIIDCDPQANATTGLNINKNNLPFTLYSALVGIVKPKDVIIKTSVKNLDIIPSKVELIGFDVEVVSDKQREYKMKNLLSEIKKEYDYIILDCPPSLSLLTVNAMVGATHILIPLQSEFYAMEGLAQLVETIQKIKQNFNPQLKIAGVVLTMFDKRTNLSRQVAEDTKNYFQNLIFKSVIPRNISLGEAPSHGLNIFEYAKNSIGAKAYLQLAKELMQS